jgi:hypothetical protein
LLCSANRILFGARIYGLWDTFYDGLGMGAHGTDMVMALERV